MSLSLCTPAARLYIRTMTASISKTEKSTKLIPVTEELHEEIAMWCFIDSKSDSAPWREQKRVEITFSTDSSGFAWGAEIGHESITDYWDAKDKCPIHL